MCKQSRSCGQFVLMQTSSLLLLLLMLMATATVATETCNYTSPNTLRTCDVPTCPTGHKPILYFLVMAPYNIPPYPCGGDPKCRPNWDGGPAVIPGALLAAEHINCDPRILPDYQLKIIISDGGCHLSNTRALVNFTSNIYLNQSAVRDGEVVGIVGGACSESTFLVAEHVNRDPLSLVQIAPSATSPQFVTNHGIYTNTIRLTVNALLFVNVFKNIIRKQKYSQVAILYDSARTYHLEISNHFQAALSKEQVKVYSVQPLLDTYVLQPLEQLEGNARLIFIFAGRKLAVEILCLAYLKNMLYPEYQFIFINRRASNFQVDVSFVDPGTRRTFNCSKEQMKAALPTATIFEPRLTRNDTVSKTYSGYSYNEIECQYNKVLEEHKRYLCQSEVTDTEYQNAYYDSTWALAMSLHNAQPEVNLTTYRYGQPKNTKTILNQFFNLSFEGAFGKVSFNNRTFDTQDVAIVNIFQQTLIDGEIDSKIVAYFSSETGNLTMIKGGNFIETAVFAPNFIHPPKELGWTVVILILVVALVIGILHYLNGTVGDLKHVKATSPQLNHLIFSGCYLLMIAALAYTCVSVFFDVYNFDRVLAGVLCNLQAWVSNYAMSLIFGTICMKTWRIWRIFNHFSSKPIRCAGDSVLIGFVVGLLSVDTIILLVWTILDPLHIRVMGTDRRMSVCFSENVFAWVIPLVLVKCFLIVGVLFLSIKTRKIPKQEFKQTKAINTLLYILLFNLTLGIVPYAIVSTSHSSEDVFIILAYVLYCGAYILATIFCVFFIFIPPIYPLIRRKWIVLSSYISVQ